MNTVEELIDHPQLAARDRWRDVPSAAGPVRMLVPPFNFEGMDIPMSAIPRWVSTPKRSSVSSASPAPRSRIGGLAGIV